MAFSTSTIEVPLAMQRARENRARRYLAFLQRGVEGQEADDVMGVEEEEAELDTWWSWCVCIGALLVNTFLIGIHHAYGVLFIAIRKEYGLSYDTASWLGSLSYGLSSFLGPLSGLVFHRIGHRACATVGTLIAVTGLIGCSFASTLAELVVSYVGMFGLGSSLAYTPAVVVCNSYFDRHLGLATGIQLSGTMIGGMILPPLVQMLTTSVGYAATMRVLAGIGCLGFVGASTFTGRQTQDRQQQHAQGRAATGSGKAYCSRMWALLRDPPFRLWVIAMSIVHFGMMTPIVHLVQRGLDIGLTLAEASSTIPLMSVTSALSRIGFGRVLDHPQVSPIFMAQLAIATMGTCLLLMPAVVNLPLLIVFGLVYGTAEGLFVDLAPLMTLRLTGTAGAGIGWSMVIGLGSLNWITGPYIAGLLREELESYDVAFILSGAVVVAAFTLLFAMPYALRQRHEGEGGLGPTAHDLQVASVLARLGDNGDNGYTAAPIFGYISIQDMPAGYLQQIRFRPGKTQHLRQGMLRAPSYTTAQTVSNLEIPPAAQTKSTPHHSRPTSRSQEAMSHPVPPQYDSLAALRRHIPAPAGPSGWRGLPTGEPPTLPARPEPVPTPPPPSPRLAPTPVPPAPLPADQLPDGYAALPVTGYLVVTPGSDQARFVVVDSRAGQTLMMRTSLEPGAADPAAESDDTLRQMLETIAEESRSSITVVEPGEEAHQRFSEVRRAVTGWSAHQEADEEAAGVMQSRSAEAGGAGPEPEPQPACRSSLDVRQAEPGRSVSPSDITLAEVAHSAEWHETGSEGSDRARSAETRSRRRSVSPTPTDGDGAEQSDEHDKPYY